MVVVVVVEVEVLGASVFVVLVTEAIGVIYATSELK